MPQRILLTGGAGFIGSHVAEALIRQGEQLTVVDNLDNFYSPKRKKANLEEIRRNGDFDFFAVDICEMEAMRDVMVSAKPETVIHLAARAGVRPSIEHTSLYGQVNIQGTLNILELCKEFGVGKFIFGSSSSVYGDTSKPPFSESQGELRPISPYAATKLSGEMFSYTYAHLYQLTAICLRFFTVYGPRQRPDLAIHKFTSLLESGQPLPVFGDGLMGRDYTYIEDIVSGVLGALEYEPAPVDNAKFEIVNLGNSRPVLLRELIELLESATGRKARINSLPLQPGDVALTWADISKARRMLGFNPATNMEIGLRRFIEWYRAAVGDVELVR